MEHFTSISDLLPINSRVRYILISSYCELRQDALRYSTVKVDFHVEELSFLWHLAGTSCLSSPPIPLLAVSIVMRMRGNPSTWLDEKICSDLSLPKLTRCRVMSYHKICINPYPYAKLCLGLNDVANLRCLNERSVLLASMKFPLRFSSFAFA